MTEFYLFNLFQIIWSQQQYELRRFKRDYVPDRNVSKHNNKKPVLRFPDPLFADQWYLVSYFQTVFINLFNYFYNYCFSK